MTVPSWDAQVLFSGDHLAAFVVGEWTAKYEDAGDGFLGISCSFNCESNSFVVGSLLYRWLADWVHCRGFA